MHGEPIFLLLFFPPRQTQAVGWQAVNSIFIFAPGNTLQNIQFFLEAQLQQQQENRTSRRLFRMRIAFTGARFQTQTDLHAAYSNRSLYHNVYAA